MKLVAFDKKRTATNVRMVLLEDVGRARIESVPLDELRRVVGVHVASRESGGAAGRPKSNQKIAG